MLKWAAIFAVIAVIAGIFGFVIDVAGAIAKFLFVVFAIGAVITYIGHSAKRRTGGG
jgi:uncharacterized membrane protein YtjA (UPF0391 family)